MDALGTVVSTIDFALKLVTYFQAVKGAREDRQKLLAEVSALGALLQVLHNRLGNSTTDSSFSDRLVMAGIDGPLRECYRTLGDTVKRLEGLVMDTSARKLPLFVERMKNFRWPFRQEEIGAMLGRIERLKSLIMLAFQTSLMEFIEKTRDELMAVGLNVERIESAVSALEADQRAHMKKTESLHIDLHALGFKLQDSANVIAKIENTVAKIGRNQQDQMMDIAIIKESMYGQELKDILKWISPLDFGEKHNAAFEKRAPETGEWFLRHPKFLAWRRGECKTLWCPGHPGVGKSVMASLVIHTLGQRIPEDTALVFIYFDYKTKYTTTQLAEAILKQLVRRRITQSGLESLRGHMAGNRPTSSELFAMLKAEVESYAQVFVVIDALDETAIPIWVPLVRHLQVLSGISLLVTSRDLSDIAAELRWDQRLDIMADDGDMRRYIEGRLLGSTGSFQRLLSANPSLHEDVITGIVEKADGMFLLARLHMNSLEKKVRLMDLRRALAELPKDLDGTYDDATERINDEHKPLVYQIISWLIHAAQPMTIRDLQYALSVEDGMTAIDVSDLHDEASLTSICVGLVVLREDIDIASSEPEGAADPHRSSKVVGLVHYTTQEYFLRRCDVSTQLADSPHFAVTCLRYLSFDIFSVDGPLDEDSKKKFMETPFTEYAIFCWGKHARQHCNDTTVRDLSMELLHDRQKVAMLGFFLCNAQNVSAIQLCAYFGLEGYLKQYLLAPDDGFDINSKDSDGDTAVTEAAIEGQEEIMRLLLARDGVDVNPKGWNGATPLTRAATYGCQAVVALLLERDDVDVNWRDNDGKAPITHAAEGGHSTIVEQLLERDDVDINTQDKDGYTPLVWAISGGHEAVVQILLRRDDLNVNPRDTYFGNTPINLAAKRGHTSILKLMLARGGVDVNVPDVNGYTALASAFTMGHEGTAQVLLARDDFDINWKDNGGNTHSAAAAYGGNEGITRSLLARKNMDINSKNDLSQTPLVLADEILHRVIISHRETRSPVYSLMSTELERGIYRRIPPSEGETRR